MTIEIFFFTVTLLYFITHLYLLTGLNKSLKLKKNKDSELPKVSVIVAGRNESQNITRCIQSLIRLKYPEDKLEVILVNDHSTDNTLDIMQDLTKSHKRFKVINSRDSISENLKGKANAIDTAIAVCNGDIIVSTDADCEVPPEWAMETAKYFSEKTAMVCGFTLIKTDNSLFSKLQCLDWIYLLTLASSSSGLKMILSCLGNNLSFSKKKYYEAGGYSSINFSVTEDLALMKKMDSVKSFEIKYPADNNCLVETLPCKDLPELFSQKRRWLRGGTGVNYLGYVIGFELYIVNILLIFGLLILNLNVFIFLIFIKTVSELILMYKVIEKFKLHSLYKYYPVFIFYFAIYGLLLPLSFLFHRKIKWKGRKF